MQQWLLTNDLSFFTEEVLSTPDWRWDLTELGREQAFQAGNWYRRWISPVATNSYSSPSPRAITTSKIVNSGTDLMIINELVEQEWGVLNQTLPSLIRTARRQFDADFRVSPDARPPGGETFREVFERVAPFARMIMEIQRRNPQTNTDITCHFSVGRALRMHFQEISLVRYQETNGVNWEAHNCQTAVLFTDSHGAVKKAISVSPAVPTDCSHVIWL